MILKFGVFMAVRIILTGQFWQKLVFVLYIFRIVFWAKINIKNEFLSKFWVLYLFYSIIWPKLRKVTKRSCKNYSYRGSCCKNYSYRPYLKNRNFLGCKNYSYRAKNNFLKNVQKVILVNDPMYRSHLDMKLTVNFNSFLNDI